MALSSRLLCWAQYIDGGFYLPLVRCNAFRCRYGQPADAGPRRAAAQRLGLTAQQWDRIDAIGALNLALVDAKASEFDVTDLPKCVAPVSTP